MPIDHLDSVHIVPFKHKYFDLLQEMHEKQHLALGIKLSMQDLPKIGYICLLGKQPVAAGFLRRVEPNYAQLDTFLSNPYMGSQIRHRGLTLITDALLEDAADLDLKGVLVITKDESILKRAKIEGFTVVDQTLLIKY